MMLRISAAVLALWAVVLSVVFIALVYIVPSQHLLTILNGIFMGIVVAVVIVYTPLIWFTFRRAKVDRVSQLALGIGILWVSIAAQRVWRIIWDNNGNPAAYASHWTLSLTVFIMIVGGALFVTAPGYPPENSSMTPALWGDNRRLLITLGALGGIVTFIISLHTGNIL